jgi:aldehyde dehydrogenase (NAD+)
LADRLWEHRERLVDLTVRQGGCTVQQARGFQVYLPIQFMYQFAEICERFDPVAQVKAGGPSSFGPGVGHALAIRDAVGVVAAITPFNYPLFLNVQKVGAALAAGCTVVLKPTEYTCLDAAELARIIDEETDIPAGAVNVLLGAGADVGEILSTHPMVDQVSFTGSTQTGQRIMAAAAGTVKRVTLELGGKSANIVFEDADLDRVLAGDGGLVVRHCGQGCGNLTRMLVQDSIYDEVLERMVAFAPSIVIGDPMDEATEMGPLVSQAQWDRVNGYIQDGIAQGATLAAGGRRPPALDRGYFMEPTIFSDVTNDMRIVQEEIFGPVVTVQRFSSEDVRLANDSIYGLNGGVWSGDLLRGIDVARRLRTGVVSVNGPRLDWDFPFGGRKQSGLGREFGKWGIEEFTEVQQLRYTAMS